MKVFVTGSTGFIGSHFVNRALTAEFQVTALRRSALSQPRVPWLRSPALLTKGMEAVTEDDLRDYDVLVHLAAHTANVPYDTLENCLMWNLMVPLALFRRAHAAGIKRFVVAGSCFEYGRAGERYEFIPPDAPLEPVASYPVSKAAASLALRAFAAETSVSALLLRVFQVFGEGEATTRFWPSLRVAARRSVDFPMTAGEQIRDFIAVEDVANAFVHACLRTDVAAGTMAIEHVGSGHPRSMRQFAEDWWQRWGAKGKLIFGAVPYRENEVMRYVPELPGK